MIPIHPGPKEDEKLKCWLGPLAKHRLENSVNTRLGALVIGLDRASSFKGYYLEYHCEDGESFSFGGT